MAHNKGTGWGKAQCPPRKALGMAQGAMNPKYRYVKPWCNLAGEGRCSSNAAEGRRSCPTRHGHKGSSTMGNSRSHMPYIQHKKTWKENGTQWWDALHGRRQVQGNNKNKAGSKGYGRRWVGEGHCKKVIAESACTNVELNPCNHANPKAWEEGK